MNQPNAEGVLRVYVDLSVDCREMREWPVGCIREFFNCIALAQEAARVARESLATRTLRAAPVGEAGE